MVIDYRSDPHIEINGTDFAWNIAKGGVVVHEEKHDIDEGGATHVTVTFVVDDLRVLSRDLSPHGRASMPVQGCPAPGLCAPSESFTVSDPGKMCGGAQ